MPSNSFDTFGTFSTLKNEDRIFTTLRLRDQRSQGKPNGGHRYDGYIRDFSNAVFSIDGHENINWDVVLEDHDYESVVNIAKRANLPDLVVSELESSRDEFSDTLYAKISPSNYSLVILLHILARDIPSFNGFFAARAYSRMGDTPMGDDDSYNSFRDYLSIVNSVTSHLIPNKNTLPETSLIYLYDRIFVRLSSYKKAREMYDGMNTIEQNTLCMHIDH